MRRTALSLALAAFAGLAAGGAALWALLPPHTRVPERVDRVFSRVVLVEPGRAPRAVARLRVADGAIAASTESASGAEPVDAPDLSGLYVSPGLSDLHVHYPPRLAVGQAELWSLLLLAHGVTSIRETGSVDGSVFAVREAIRAGRFPGPRIFACGAILDGEPPSFPSNRVLTRPERARAAVADLASQGADCIKAYNMLSPETLAALREAAAAARLPVIGHVPHAVPFEAAGVVDVQHGTGAVLVDRERVGRLDFRAEDWETLDDARIAFVARVSLEQDIAHTPTLVNARMRRLLTDAEEARVQMATDTGLRHLPHFWPEVWRAIWRPPFAAGDARGEALHELFRRRQARLTAALHAAGVRIHAGTDTLMPFVAPGASLLGELADLVAAGIPPESVFEIATREAGRSLGLPGLGTLQPGAPADLLFLRSDPSRDPTAFARIEAVLADGRLYRRADLDDMLAAADAHFRGRFYSAVMGWLAALLRNGFAPDG
jgi:cytosine/adenosine deaminase-related metal-dependent hydrolase